MRRLYFTAYAALLVLFVLLGFFIHASHNLPGDSAINHWFAGVDIAFVDSLMRAASTLGETIPAVITVSLVVIILLLSRRKLEALFVAVLPSLAALFTWLIKVLVDRPRPGDEIFGNGGLSFPSGHVSHMVVFLGFLIYLMPELIKQRVMAITLQVIMFAIILLIMLSRVYLGEHWVSDVLGSVILGGLMLAPAIVLYKRYYMRVKDARVA